MSFSLRRVLCLVAMIMVVPELYGAVTAAPATDSALDGYLGIGAMSTPDYAGSGRNHVWLAPIANFDYDDTFYVHLDRAGVRLWSNDDQNMAFGIAAEPRFGFRATDGSRLTGMQTRHDAIEGGPTFEWEFPQVSVSVAYFTDVSDTSDGQALHVSFFHQWLDHGPWDVGVYADFEHLSSKITQYYFGVRPAEAAVSRPAYQPNAAVNTSFGLTGAYRLGKHYALLFGGETNVLGQAAADSPIVRSRIGYMAYVGVGLAF
jgi:outer membrane protein